MSSEKKSLIRFLVIYIFSTLFLIGIGEYLYYKLAKNSELNTQKIILENKINNYLKNRVKIRRFSNFQLLENMAIFKDNQLVSSNFKPPKIDFKKEVFVCNEKVFYLKKLIRPFGTIYILTFKKLPENNLFKHLFIFNFLILFFVTFISIILGKIFLAPMKKTIENLENFITDSTHEMNTPISIIMSNIEMLEIKGIENKEFKRIQNGSKRLNKIFEDLKFISLNHKIKKEISEINLKEFILERLSYLEIKSDVNLENCSIKIDKEDLMRIIDNLLTNAKKYSEKYIKIELTKNYLMIKNDGEIKDLKIIKNKFVRENKNEGGFGLGLYIVEKICNNYGFMFEIKNNNGVEVKIVYK